ncbi:MAG: hypothetical protein OJI67_17030 [Prosthecobacter sp.]|nr:hypothetical protein [Prosthecobacter sp.]
MKTSTLLTLAIGLFTLGTSLAQAQNYVLESKVAVLSTVTTQGTEKVTTAKNGTEVKRLKVEVKPFTNREILAEMLTRELIGDSASGWTLVYLVDANEEGGLYAKKSGVIPVAVPTDLVTLPVFGVSLQTGTETTKPGGGSFVGLTEIALATANVKGLPVSGLATNGIRTLTAKIEGNTYQIDTVSTTLRFTGGGETGEGVEILKGSIAVGSAKVSTLVELP